MLTIWGRTNSINVQKVLWCTEELGLDYKRVDAGMSFGVVNDESYRARNPNGRVPTMDDNGFVLWESNVIVRYLAAVYGAGSLCPADARERALAEQWMDWQQTTLLGDIVYLFWGLIRHDPDRQDKKAQADASARLGDIFAVADAHLKQRDFMLGEQFTMADIPIGATMWRWQNMPVERPSLPNLERWYARLKERPAFARHVALPLS